MITIGILEPSSVRSQEPTIHRRWGNPEGFAAATAAAPVAAGVSAPADDDLAAGGEVGAEPRSEFWVLSLVAVDDSW